MVYLRITLEIAPANRPAAAGVYQRCKAPFLTTVAGATWARFVAATAMAAQALP